MFVQLHGHSHYSLLEAIGKPKDLVAQAKELGMTTLGLTDYNGMYGAIDFYKACLAEDIKPLIGVEIALVQDRLNKEGKESPGTITLLAKNYEGYHDLLELISHANLEGFHSQPRIDRQILKEKGHNLIAWMGGAHSLVGKMILQKEQDTKILETIKLLQGFFTPGDFYLELIAQDESKYPDIAKINKQILSYATSLNCKLFCNTNYHYIHSEDKEAYEVALSIKDGKRIYDDDRRKANGDRYLMSEEEVSKIMISNGYEKEAIEGMMVITGTIAEKAQLEIPLNTILFPNYDSDPEIKKKYEEVKDTLIVE